MGNVKKIKPTIEYIDDSYTLGYEIIKRDEDIKADVDSEMLKDILQLLNDTSMDIYKIIYNTPIIISKTDRDNILNKYFTLTNQLHTKKEYKRLMVPQPVTLTNNHISMYVESSIISNYLVTEKADGDRYIMYIDDSKRGYLINSKFEIIDTGIEFPDSQGDYIVDGEYIT